MRAFVFVLLLVFVSPVAAQPTLRNAEMRLQAPDPELWKAQRRARLMLAIGTGLAVGSGMHAAWASRDRVSGCGNESRASLYTAGFLGGAGVSLMIVVTTLVWGFDSLGCSS